AVLPYSSPLAPREESRPPAVPAENDPAAAFSLAAQVGRELQESLPLAEREDYFTPPRNADKEGLPQRAAASLPATGHAPVGLAALWFVGAVVALAPLVFGLARTFVLRRKARPIDDARWTSLLDELRQRLALARQVGLYESDAALMPMTWGVLRPVVMLPRQAQDWPDRLRRFVLLHELAHVKRCDVGCQLLGRSACVLYWFHPLAWYALRRLRIERELACDDAVVLAGERATDYAAELLEIARAYRPVSFAAAVAMAQRSNLEHRLRAMFDRACSHLPVSPRAARLLLAGVLMLVTAIAAVRLAPRATAEDQKEVTTSSATEDVQAKTSPNAAAKSLHLNGRVVDDAGQPVEQARLRIFHVDSESGTWINRGRIVAESRTDTRGEFSLNFADDPKFNAREHFTEPSRIVLADADGYACDWQELQPGEEDIALALLRDDVPLEGRVLDLEGQPIRGVRVSVERVTPAAKDLDEWIEAAKQNPATVAEDWMAQPINSAKRRNAPKVAHFPGKKSLWVAPAGFLPSTATDENGKFKL
ncbi:MAG: M56 family metallopeptidase, partial [Pirellulales bacterium]